MKYNAFKSKYILEHKSIQEKFFKQSFWKISKILLQKFYFYDILELLMMGDL